MTDRELLEAAAKALYERYSAVDRLAPGGALTWDEMSPALKQEWMAAAALAPQGVTGHE